MELVVDEVVVSGCILYPGDLIMDGAKAILEDVEGFTEVELLEITKGPTKPRTDSVGDVTLSDLQEQGQIIPQDWSVELLEKARRTNV